MSVGVVLACDAVRGRFGSRLSPCFLCPPCFEFNTFLGTVADLVLTRNFD